ncbi:MAG TPA: ABC transporter [Elusimicrobia bacterium]|nr:MAG: ABC transporter [Elusimicrobia bacterium GWA2_66_18]OGR77226.1 MAG: ABC transporter [Elusimicrobia bacterium GWC2_65_9]HAZ07767.1 ABC transporter [Elusimicrobiota bacterium]
MAPAIETKGLTKDYRSPVKEPGLWGGIRSLVNRRYKDIRAVNDVSLRIEEGELVGFLGANGAGKTTTLKMLSGLLTPTAGEALALGHVPWRREAAFQKKLSLVMGQRSQLWWELPAYETFRLNQAIYGIAEADFKMHLDELVDLLDLGEHLSVPVKKLSLGERMRAELAAALLHGPRLLLLDEPTIGLDVVMQKKVREFVKAYNQRHGATIMLTSHNMTDVVALCKRVIVIERGRILYDGALDRLVESYADHKILRVRFSTPVTASDLRTLGSVVHCEGESATLEVPRANVSASAAALLRSYPVADLNVEEVAIDDIVRRLFSHS